MQEPTREEIATNESERKMQTITLVINILVDKWWIILSVGLICGILAFIYTLFIAVPVYEAKASVLAIRSDVDISKMNENVRMSNELMKDYLIIVKSNKTMSYAIETLDAEDMHYTATQLASKVTASNTKDSDVIVITVQDKSPEMAARIANAVADGFQQTVNELLLTSEENYTNYSSVFERAVVSTKQVYPNVPVSVLIAILIGILLPGAIIFLNTFFSSNIVSALQIRYITKLDVIGNIYYFYNNN